MYFFDSNILIGFLRGSFPAVVELLKRTDASLFAIPAVVEAKLLLGAEKSTYSQQERLRVESLLLPFRVVPFDSACAAQYARIRAHLEKEGRTIGANDYLIAATALAHAAVLVTNNVDEFARVPGLAVESWEEISFR